LEEEHIHSWARDFPYNFQLSILTSLSVSLFYLVGLFDLWDGLRTLFISAAATYIISAKIKSPYMPWIGFVFLMGHMSINHIYRQSLNDDSVVDITGGLSPTRNVPCDANMNIG
jgi:hypothetical protein